MKKFISKTMQLMIQTFFILACIMAFNVRTVSADEGWLWPVEGITSVSQGFGGDHQGIDISASGIYGHAIRAAKSGVVTSSSNSCSHVNSGKNRCSCNGGMGNYVIINHGDGTQTRYLHMIQGSAIASGTRVTQGQTIGKVGSSGDSSGAHLHFDMWKGGSRVNNNPSVIGYKYSTVSITLTVKQTSPSSIRSDWKAVSGADQYFVEVKDSNGNRLDKVWTKALGWDFYNLTPNKTYTVRLDVLKNGKSLGETSKSIYLTGNTDNTAKGSQTISEGDYRIISYLDSSKSVEVSGASKKNCANVQLGQNTDNASQIWHIKYLGDGYYSMEDKNSGRYLDVQNGDTKSGTNVWLYDGNGSDAQKWVIRETGDGWYNIVSKRSGLNLDVYGGQKTNGTNIQIYSDNGSGAQKWGFVAYGKSIGKTVSNGYYQMGTMLDTSKLVNVSGAGKNNSTNVQLWQKTSKAAQTWKISYLGDGYYSIMDVNSGKYLDVAGGRKLANTNVQIYQKNNTDSQKWIIKSEGSGRYSIISKISGHYLDCDGAKSTNGTNLKTWYKFKSGNNAQLWKFTRVYNLSTPKVNTPTSPKKKQMKATWKKVTGAKGYVVQFSTSKSFSKVAKSITTSSLTAKYTSATKGKYYYVRVRAYTKTGLGNTIYSSWSTVSKKVKCK